MPRNATGLNKTWPFYTFGWLCIKVIGIFFACAARHVLRCCGRACGAARKRRHNVYDRTATLFHDYTFMQDFAVQTLQYMGRNTCIQGFRQTTAVFAFPAGRIVMWMAAKQNLRLEDLSCNEVNDIAASIDTSKFFEGLVVPAEHLSSISLGPVKLCRISMRPSAIPSANVIRPADGKRVILLDFHGGAYVTGLPLQNLGFFAKIIRNLTTNHDVEIISVEYPLAPEHPYPSALIHAYAAYQWIRTIYAPDAESVILNGDSAGGGICLALMLMLKSNEFATVTQAPSASSDPRAEVRQLPLPDGIVVVSPWVDLVNMTQPSFHDPFISNRDYLNRDWLYAMAKHYVPFYDQISLYSRGRMKDARQHPYVSPLYADESMWTGMSPILFIHSDSEVFVDSIRALHDVMVRANDGENVVDGYIAHGLPHDFPITAGLFPKEEELAVHAICTFVERLV